MDGWGALKMLVNRQTADKRRKSELRNKRNDQKTGYFTETKLSFPKHTKPEIKKVIEKIRKKNKANRRKNIILYFFISLFFALLIIKLFKQ